MSEHAPTFFATPQDFRAWLAAHHDTAQELWVGYYKVATKLPSVTWPQTVDEALCFGWIDGVRKSRDAQSYVIRFTPRTPRSVWSQRNIDRVETLRAQGRMQPAGLAAYAHKDAHPDSGYTVASLAATLPEPMVERFQRRAEAWAFYQAQPPGYRKQTAHWVTSAKREATRERRLATLIDDSANGLRIKQLRKR